jgi:membrane protease YdiL (CAAX protease family)
MPNGDLATHSAIYNLQSLSSNVSNTRDALSMPEPAAQNRLYLKAENYWIQSRRPVVSLVFIAPLMIVYEVGVLIWHVQNGADAWMRQLLDLMGFSQHFLLPALTVCVLLAWHYLAHQPWRFSPSVLTPMAVECLLLAVCLQGVYVFQRSLFFAFVEPIQLDIGDKVKTAVSFLGAGVYEELLFRLLLLSAMSWLIRRWWTRPKAGVVLAVLLSSLIFAAAHYIGPAGYAFDWLSLTSWFGFIFRFIAGVFFSILFVFRGFGIAAGTHAAYDILAALL